MVLNEIVRVKLPGRPTDAVLIHVVIDSLCNQDECLYPDLMFAQDMLAACSLPRRLWTCRRWLHMAEVILVDLSLVEHLAAVVSGKDNASHGHLSSQPPPHSTSA